MNRFYTAKEPRLQLKPWTTVVAAVSLVGMAWTLGASPHDFARPAQSQGVSAPPTPADSEFFASHGEEISESVFVDLTVSALPLTLLADGVVVRPLCINYQLLRLARPMGGRQLHRLVAASSTETFDLSISDLDIDLARADQTAPGTYRDYTVRIAPRPGKTWGNVASYRDDIAFSAARQE